MRGASHDAKSAMSRGEPHPVLPMDSITVVLVMLLAVVASGYAVRLLPFPVPLPLMQIAMGVLVSEGFDAGVMLDPTLFFVLFLPPLLFLDGWRMPKTGLLRDSAIILELALGLVVFTVIGAGFFIHWLIPAMPLAVAFALAAIVSPTDPVAVSSITARVRMPKRLMHILEGEALLNDATGLVCFRFAVAAAMTGSFSAASASLSFLWVASAGLAIGVATTLAISLFQRWLSRRVGDEPGSRILIGLLVPFGAYLLAEHVDASGILAAVAAGITASYVELRGRGTAATRVQATAVWDTVQFALNGIMFVLLGEQLPRVYQIAQETVGEGGGAGPWRLAVHALAITVALVVLRLVWVWVSLRVSLHLARRRGQAGVQPQWRLVVATSLAGVRGAITLAGVLTLPFMLPGGAPFPAREQVIFLATAVIMLSLVLASVCLPALLRGLELPEDANDGAEEDNARRHAAAAAIAAIEKARAERLLGTDDADLYTRAATHVISLYQHRLGDDLADLSDPDGGGDGDRDGGGNGADNGADNNADNNADNGQDRASRRQEQKRATRATRVKAVTQAERALRLAALQAERKAIYRLARQSTISDETARRLVRELDLLESRHL
jgi:Na+/H+ antiporter